MFPSILQDLKECLIAQEKQRNPTKRFEWMQIFLQNVVQMDPMEKFLRVQILQKSYAIPLNQRSPYVLRKSDYSLRFII